MSIIYTTDSLVLGFNRMLGGTKVEQRGSEIVISGFPGTQIADHITKYWRTSRIVANMFVSVSYYRMTLPAFFAVEVKYVFEKLLSDGRLPLGVKGFVKDAVEQLTTNTWLRSTTEDAKPFFNRKALNKFKKTPLPSQMEFIDVYEYRKQQYGLNGYLLTTGIGGGKTLQQLFIAEMLDVELSIIVCPKVNVFKPWVETLESEYYERPNFFHTGDGAKVDGLHYRYIVVHYESLGQLLPYIPQLRKMRVSIHLDESHNFNDVKSDRTNNFIELCRASGSEHIIPASGTPVKAMATECIPFLRSIDPLFTESVEARFKKIFGVSKTFANDIMCNRIGVFSHRTDNASEVANTKTEIEYKVTFPGAEKYTLPMLKIEMRDFIEARLKHYQDNKDIYVQQYRNGLDVFKTTLRSKEQFRDYDQYLADIRVIQKTTDYSLINDVIARANRYEKKTIHPTLSGRTLAEFKDARSVIKYVTLKVRGEALGRVLGRRRADCHVEMVRAAKLEAFVEDATKKTLIFTSYVDVVKELGAYFSQKAFGGRYKPMMVYTETAGSLRHMVDRLGTDPKANPLIATYQSLSTGVPVTHASTAIMFNQPFRSYEKEQARGRIDRKGQDVPVTFVDVILDTGDVPNISTRSMDIMQWSKEQVEEITGVKSSMGDSAGLEGYTEHSDYSLEQFDLGYNDLTAVVVMDGHDRSRNNQFADRFYGDLAAQIQRAGIDTVILSDGTSATLPTNADLYIGHGTGIECIQCSDLHRDAYVISIVHPDAQGWLLKQQSAPDLSPPPRGHYVLTPEQKTDLNRVVDSVKINNFGMEYFDMEKDMSWQYSDLTSTVAGIERMDEAFIVGEVLPGLEGLFDSAVRIVNKAFAVNKDKGRVAPFSTGWRLRHKLKKVDHSQMVDLHVMRPEGLNVTYLKMAEALRDQFSHLNTHLTQLFTACTTYAARLASDDDSIGSITAGEFNTYLKGFNLDAQKKAYASLFQSRNTATATYGDVIANAGDWAKIDNAIQNAHEEYSKISPTEIEDTVDRVYAILDDLVDQFRHNKKIARLSKVQVKDLSVMAYSLASTIEFYSGLMYGWQMLNQSLVETETAVLDADFDAEPSDK